MRAESAVVADTEKVGSGIAGSLGCVPIIGCVCLSVYVSHVITISFVRPGDRPDTQQLTVVPYYVCIVI